ncbi:MAG TPA: hypothetical protein ENK05_09125 [Gammaproteobacteria bacterium]|nr:hypothetical protein [Gammaproteobacteria bacterium]
MSRPDISEERLNAFVDDELDAAEKEAVFEAMSQDPSLLQQTCELRQLSELVRHAYDQPPQAERYRPGPRPATPWGRAAAAVVLLALGTLLGWFGHQKPLELPEDSANLQAMVWGDEDRAFENADLATVADRNELKRVILHLNTSSPDKFGQALDTAEQLLKTYADDNHGAEIEVVANASAIKMLRAGSSPYADRVRRLQEQYFNLTFLACKDAMDHIRELEGLKTDVKLLPGVDVTPSALEHILNRLNDGWVYINI